ncbi:MAG: VTT domain-containing protein [Pseudomonadota bacterium]
MGAFLRLAGRFLTNMDAKAVTSLGVSLVLLAFVILMFAYGQQWLDLGDENAVTALMDRAYASRWSVLIVISVYVILALTGFPQILLIAATVIAFGPRNGALYAWFATMVSASVTFGLGRVLGGGWVRRFGGETVHKSIGFLSRHGIFASGLVRVVPSAPFIVVNAAAGAAHIPIWKFWAGTAIGIVPKILFVALMWAMAPDEEAVDAGVGGVLAFFTSREPRHLALLFGVIAAWLAILLLARWLYARMRRGEGEEAEN